MIPAILYLIAAVATALLAKGTGADTVSEGIALGLVTGVGYAVPLVAVEATFDPNKPRPGVWFAITAAYHLIGFVILGVIVSVWH